jgi:16S rRNA (cytidine1402-2'-O)-methyltransferase
MTLILLPNVLAEELSHEAFFPPSVEKAVQSLEGLIAESQRGGRHFLRRFKRQLPICLLNEHTSSSEMERLLIPLLKGETWGLISDAGLPCLADPGSALVMKARERGNILIEALIGPSSLTLGLMLSGLGGQAFAFHGYLPREKQALIRKLRLLEECSLKDQATQLFMETPYRNQKLLETIIGVLSEKTYLSIAWDLTLPAQTVVTQSILKWKKAALPDLSDKPAIFLMRSNQR